jgi:hypothetical protein
MAILKDEEEQKGQGTSQLLGQAPQTPQTQQAGQQPQQQESQAPAMIGGSSATQTSAPVKAMPKQQKAGTGTFSNLKSYLQAAQGGGQQKVAQAATQQVQKLGAGAQKGITQAQQTFGQKVGAGSGAIFQAGENQYLDPEKAIEQARKSTEEILGAARGVTYQAPEQRQPTQLTPEQIAAQNQERANLEGTVGDYRVGPVLPRPESDAIRQYKAGELVTPLVSESQPAAPAQPQQYFTPEQTQRFSEIINAQYQGPESLQQAGLYESAAQKARSAQEAATNAQTATGRELLLKDIFGRSRDYSRGASKLDALLLNTSRQGLEQLQEQAKVAGGMQQQLQAAQNQSVAEAQNRARAIEGIRSGARGEFTKQQGEELAQTESRIEGAKTQAQELRDYFSNIFKDTQNKPVDLSATEAALLGIESGEGFYNLTPEQLLNFQDLKKEKLISKNERARLEALSQLAGMASDKGLSTEFFTPYQDASLAGTQSTLNALNQENIRSQLNTQEKQFLENINRDITGYGTGSASYDKGMFQGKGWVKDSAEFSQNLSELLSKAGYNITPEDRQVMSSPEVLKAIMGAAEQGGSEQEILARAYSTMQQTPTAEGVTSSLTSGGVTETPELDIAGLAKTAGEAQLAQTGAQGLAGLAATGFGSPAVASVAPYYLLAKLATDADFREQVGGLTKTVLGEEAGKFTESALSTVDAVGGLTDMLGSMATLGMNESFGSDLFGGGKSSARKKATKKAQEAAAKNLRSEIQSGLGEAGFERRASILNKDITQEGISKMQTEQSNINKELQDKQTQIKQADLAKQKYKNVNIDNSIFQLEQSLSNKRLKPSQKKYLQSQLDEYKSVKDLIQLDTAKMSEDINKLSSQSKDLSGKLKQQESLLGRASAVQERNAGLMELLKRLDKTNI